MEGCNTIKLPDVRIDFDEGQHLYSLRGIKLPSVTQIMRPMNLMIYDGVSQIAMSEAANRGTRAHEQISNWVTYGMEEVDEDTVPFMNAFRSFEEMYSPKWVGSEYKTFHTALRYAGTLDLIGYIEPDNGNGVDVIDLKTTSVWHGVPLKTQVAAYAEALKSQGVAVRKMYGLQLLKNGTFRFEELDGKEGYRIFLMCLGLYNAMAEELT